MALFHVPFAEWPSTPLVVLTFGGKYVRCGTSRPSHRGVCTYRDLYNCGGSADLRVAETPIRSPRVYPWVYPPTQKSGGYVSPPLLFSEGGVFFALAVTLPSPLGILRRTRARNFQPQEARQVWDGQKESPGRDFAIGARSLRNQARCWPDAEIVAQYLCPAKSIPRVSTQKLFQTVRMIKW